MQIYPKQHKTNVIENKEGQSEDIDDNMPNSVSADIEPNSQSGGKEMNAPLRTH